MVNMDSHNWLANKFKSQDWFHSVGQDQYKRTVVYVHYVSLDILNVVPSDLNGQVLVHYACSLPSGNNYRTKVSNSFVPPIPPMGAATEEVNLHEQLWNLQRVCGRNNLIDIFYEVCDGDDAVTDVSLDFPEVRTAMGVLYDKIGPDVLFDELDIEYDD